MPRRVVIILNWWFLGLYSKANNYILLLISSFSGSSNPLAEKCSVPKPCPSVIVEGKICNLFIFRNCYWTSRDRIFNYDFITVLWHQILSQNAQSIAQLIVHIFFFIFLKIRGGGGRCFSSLCLYAYFRFILG